MGIHVLVWVILITGIAIIFAIILGIAVFFDSWSCSSRWGGTYPTSYGLMSGCRVKVNAQWMPEDAVRVLP